LKKLKQGVALTGRNTTGPPSRAAAGEVRCICECYRRRQTTYDDRSQRPLLVWSVVCLNPTLCVRVPDNGKKRDQISSENTDMLMMT